MEVQTEQLLQGLQLLLQVSNNLKVVCCLSCNNVLKTGLSFFLDGRVFPNNSIVPPGDIGEGSCALYCLTDSTQCCSTEAGGELGVWRSPDGSDVSGSTTADVYLVRGFSSLLLNRRSSAVGPTGVYTCLIPDAGNMLRILYLGIYNSVAESELNFGLKSS